PTAQMPHGGGLRLPPGSPYRALLQQWLLEGAPGPGPGERVVVGLQVTPAERVLRHRETQQLRATALYSDGSRADVTRWARYNTNNEGVATVTPEGLIHAGSSGLAPLLVRYQGQVAVVRTLVPFGNRRSGVQAFRRSGDGGQIGPNQGPVIPPPERL